MTHVKICGFQTSEAAIAAVDAGADAIGFVFVPSARRRLNMTKASTLIAELREHYGDAHPEIVGLFADQPVEDVKEHIQKLGLDSVQLCGAENVGYTKDLGVPIYKVIGVDPSVPISAQMPRIMVLQHRHQLAGHKIVIDTKVAGEYGGTGLTFDWEMAAELARGLEFSLAGGLTPENVGAAVAQVKPWGVDASSGVESDGEKDLAKIVAFVDAIRAVDNAAKTGVLNNLPFISKIVSSIKALRPNEPAAAIPAAAPAAALAEETSAPPARKRPGLGGKLPNLKLPSLKLPSVKLPSLKFPGKKGK
jgi:phosphoribosylanthranilate isomerase